jgi:hypothetical protein
MCLVYKMSHKIHRININCWKHKKYIDMSLILDKICKMNNKQYKS